MIHGYIRVAAVTPEMRVADCTFNGDTIISYMKECAKQEVKVAVFPELSITGYSCGDLFFQHGLLNEAFRVLKQIVSESKDLDLFLFVGLPLVVNGKLYNVGAAIKDGKLLGLIPKTNIPNYVEHFEMRTFSESFEKNEIIYLGEELGEVPFGTDILFRCDNFPKLVIAAEICEDLWVPIPKSNYHAMAGATLIANLSASAEVTGKHLYRRTLVNGQSARLIAAYVYAASGEGETSTDIVFGGHNMICENGKILLEKPLFQDGMIVTEVDLDKIMHERMRVNTFKYKNTGEYQVVSFSIKHPVSMYSLMRKVPKNPFIPDDKENRRRVAQEVTTIQTIGLKKRLLHIGTKSAVIGVSGGLDSTLALLILVKTFDQLGLDRKNILAVTMPCFGTTDRTYRNALELAKKLGVTLREINIKEAVTGHLKDIGHDITDRNVTYENAQARERTQILMDLANETGGIVIGTGDMSELALGWATYGGDMMSMYGLNASVPKTLVRHLVFYFAEQARETGEEMLSDILIDILDTPVSPELLPPDKDGEILQKTEEIVGPYELHDFFLYYMLRWGFSPDKIYRLACTALSSEYDETYIYQWIRVFYRRFFFSQFKRSSLPDGIRVGTVGLSPKGDFRMPSDACVQSWMKILDEIAPKNWEKK